MERSSQSRLHFNERSPPEPIRERHLVQIADIVAAYVSNPQNRIRAVNPQNRIRAVALPELIAATGAALKGLGDPAAESTADAIERPSAQDIRKSVTKAGVRSFIDGKVYISMKRHPTARGYTPEGYREAFGLPRDYPMVSAAFSAKRSAMAKAIGLGTRVRDKPAKAASAKAKGRPKPAPNRIGRTAPKAGPGPRRRPAARRPQPRCSPSSRRAC